MNYLDWLRQENADAAMARETEQSRIAMLEAEIVELKRKVALLQIYVRDN